MCNPSCLDEQGTLIAVHHAPHYDCAFWIGLLCIMTLASGGVGAMNRFSVTILAPHVVSFFDTIRRIAMMDPFLLHSHCSVF